MYQLKLLAVFLRLAVCSWRQLAAAALGIQSSQLPKNSTTISKQLRQAAVRYTSALLAGAKLTAEDLSEPLADAISSGITEAVPQLLGHLPVAAWTLSCLEPAWDEAAEQGYVEAFQQVVQAGLAAAEAQGEAAAAAEVQGGTAAGEVQGGTAAAAAEVQGEAAGAAAAAQWEAAAAAQGEAAAAAQGEAAAAAETEVQAEAAAASATKMDVLSSALVAAAAFDREDMVGWLLQQGQGGWTAESMEAGLHTALARGKVKQLQQLLSGCGIIWTPDELSVHLDHAAQHRYAGKALMQRVLAAAAGSGQEWSVEHLVDALTSAAAHTSKGAAAVKLLLKYPGIVWTCADLQPAVEALTARQVSPWRRTSVRIEDLIAAATDQWTVEQLSTALRNSIPKRSKENFTKLLKLESVQWTVPSLLAALEESCRVLFEDEYFNPILAVPGLVWEEETFVAVARIAVDRECWDALRALLLQAGGPPVPQAAACEVMGLLMEPRVAALSNAMTKLQQYRDREVVMRSVNLLPKVVQCMQHLLELAAGAWSTASLKDALAVAAAAGEAGLVSSTLAAPKDGEEWGKVDVVIALSAAARAKHWSVVSQLLAAPEGGWSEGELQAVVEGTLELIGGKRAGDMLRQKALPFLAA